MLAHETLVAFGAITDAERATRFYRDTLGLTLRADDPVAVVFDANGVELRLQKLPEVVPRPFTVLGWRVTDLDAQIDMLSARGVAFERFGGMAQDARGAWRAPGGARVAWFRDPDGNLLSVAQYSEG